MSGPRLCDQFVVALAVDGASVSVFDSAGNQSTVCATDSTAARAETLQFELGEGPHWQALTSGLPVLCPDILGLDDSPWPMFSEAAYELGLRAVFALPMKIGAATVGVVDLHCFAPRHLDAREEWLASSTAHRIATAAVRSALRSADDPAGTEHEKAPSLRREVHQATGMIQAQLDTSATEALIRLRSYAFATNTPIDAVARAVVAGYIDFSSLPD